MDSNFNCTYRSVSDIEKEIAERKKKKSKTNDKEFLKDGLETENIRKVIKDIRLYITNNKDNKKHTEIVDKLKTDYEFFATRYPMLFSMATKQDDFDYTSLEYFLNMRDRIISNEMTVDEASIQVGEEWLKKFVDVSKLQQK